ncbi:hypothetical protein O4H66_24400 [Comamonadaceae bacterium G21597-S1]|nr:hypothetical protein [Comamonadaceae bacterium G21597-S1]
MQSDDSGKASSDELARILALSEKFDEDVLCLLKAGWSTSTQRVSISMAYCKAAIEHAISQRVLIEAGLHGTALSLIRLHFEAVVRAAWSLQGAKDEWVEKFCRPVRDGDFSEPQMGPPIPAMLDAIKQYAPDAAREFARLNETTKVMHSFVHGGAHLVVHALRGYPRDKLVAVMMNRNLLTLQLTNVIVIGSQMPNLRGSVGKLGAVHAACMPPLGRV